MSLIWIFLLQINLLLLQSKDTNQEKLAKMVVAKWKGKVIAESNKTIVIEGNHYFPTDSIKKEFLKPNSKTSTCPWKGVANYYDVVVDGEVNKSAAWYYPNPNPAAANIKGMVAFYNGVQVS